MYLIVKKVQEDLATLTEDYTQLKTTLNSAFDQFERRIKALESVGSKAPVLQSSRNQNFGAQELAKTPTAQSETAKLIETGSSAEPPESG